MGASRFKRPCLDCGRLAYGSRCEEHQKVVDERTAQRLNNLDKRQRQSQLYNYQYRKQAKIIRETATHCHLCKQAFTPSDRIEADHLIAGDPSSPLAAAHRVCNQRRGNKPLTDV